MDNDYYKLYTGERCRVTGDWACVSEIPGKVHSPQTTYIDPINPGFSYSAPRRD